MADEMTAELKKSYQALQLELEERERAEISLKESEERFRTIADFTDDWECWMAPDGTYIIFRPHVNASLVIWPMIFEKSRHI